jgi:hypothetical protein
MVDEYLKNKKISYTDTPPSQCKCVLNKKVSCPLQKILGHIKRVKCPQEADHPLKEVEQPLKNVGQCTSSEKVSNQLPPKDQISI